MFYTVLENDSILKADNKEYLTRFYSNILELQNVTVAEFNQNQDKYELQDGVLVDISNTPEYKNKKEKERRDYLDGLFVTRGDVFEALILSMQITETQIGEMIENYEMEPLEKALILNRFRNALNFYRGYPIFDLLGNEIDVTSEQWDSYFEKATNEETKSEAWKELLPLESVEEPIIEEI